MARQSIQSLMAAFIIAVACYAGTAMGHGKVTPEEDVCVRQVGGNMLHLSTYQPQHDQNKQYCTEIPLAGETYLVVDLLDQPLRNMPVGLKVFRGDAEEGETVAQVNANYHPDGVISGIGKLDKGLYSVVVTAEGIPPLNYYYQLRVEMADYGKIARAWIGPIIAMLFLLWLTQRFMQSGRWRTWFDSLR
ncbi:hypothetical protein [Nitrosomonas communis]|uniref:hypothetical protein n=1 Tax=Nitrosomonas communis TaxID=44574 RepID=UPI0026EEA3F6|nr:hypothetical protein [Nitrosomonas communis]